MKLDTTPALLLAPSSGHDAIDSDIIFENGKYYMYYKDETTKGIFLAEAEHASGPYKEIHKISEGSLGVEGPNIYKLNGENKWLLMSDAYGNGYYVMQETTDLENFRTVSRADYSFDFTPRHGYVIPITGAQYNALISAYPSAGLHTFNTDMQQVSVRTAQDVPAQMPETVTAYYSDGGSMELPVQWDTSTVDTSRKGSYTVKGTVLAADYANPLIQERADPYVVRGDDGYYYFTASYPAYGNVNQGYDRIILRRSKTVAGLADAEEVTVWKAHASGIMAKHIWAPEMHYIGGKWYIFFAAGASTDVWAIRPYVLQCDGDPMTGKWSECGQMQASAGDTDSFTSFSLDMTYFENGGKHYLIWAEIKGDSSLFMAEINPDEPWKLISKPILLTKPEYSWELVNHRVNEGAAVLKTGGRVYVFFSASGTGSEYCVGRMWADENANLMDTASWHKEKNAVLSTSDLDGESGPGHNSFVTDENGNLLIVYHARPSAHDSKTCGTYASDPLYDPCRHTRIRQVYIDADGAPNIALKPNEFLAESNRTVTAKVTIS
jgi:GH43 family beta-xylosidase